MKRLSATLLTMSLVVAAGCNRSYDERLKATIERMKYLQRLDSFLTPAAQGKFKDLKIYIRPPKPMEVSKTFGLTENPGQYDLAYTFLGLPKVDAQAKEGAPPPDPNAVLRLHVLARKKKPKNTTKKGEPPPPEPATPRGDFVADTRTLLASDTGGGDAALSGQLKSFKSRSNDWKRLQFAAGNGDDIRVYFYKQGDYEVALVWDIPPMLVKQSQTGIDLCLQSFAVGTKADRYFLEGEGSDDSGAVPGPAPGGAGPAGPAF